MRYSELHVKNDLGSGCIFVIGLNTEYGERCSGGTRMKVYPSVEKGIEEALNLTDTMTKKCRVIGKAYNGGFSGGKGVIIGDTKTQKTEKMLLNYAEFVNSLNGKFYTGTDLNIIDSDAEIMAKNSNFIDGLSTGKLGNTSVATAFGVFWAMKKIMSLYTKSPLLKGKKICIEGVGSVGMKLLELLINEGAEIFIFDINKEKLNFASNKYGAKIIKNGEQFTEQFDIFSPNARGALLNNKNIKSIKSKFIIGAANNQIDINTFGGNFTSPFNTKSTNLFAKFYKSLYESNTIYVPDYVVGIGGVYTSICEQLNRDLEFMMNSLRSIIEDRIENIFNISIKNNISLLEVSEKLFGQ